VSQTPANANDAGAPVESGGGAIPPPSRAAPDESQGVIDLIRALKSGELPGKSMAVGDRRRCIAHLLAEGYSVVEVAEILKVSDRTVQRDKDAIRRANALAADPNLAGELAGALLQQAERDMIALGRVVRDRETSAAVRVEAIRVRWQIGCQLTERFQSLGFLPETARQIRADLTHRVGEPPGVEALQAQFTEIETLLAELAPDDAAARERTAALRVTLGQLRLADGLGELKQSIESKQSNEAGAIEHEQPFTDPPGAG
jgi:hypothetical protein